MNSKGALPDGRLLNRQPDACLLWILVAELASMPLGDGEAGMIYALAFLIGVVAGLRAMTAPAARLYRSLALWARALRPVARR